MSRNSKIRSTGLARALSKLGYCSRSAARSLIERGEIRLNGRVVRDPEASVALGRDRIETGGSNIRTAKRIYLLLNKPHGIVTTTRDEKGRETIYSLLPASRQWLAPVGRLDKASEGLLLLTNDSEWAARITDPSGHLDKTYHVQVNTVASNDLLQRLTRGVAIDGDFLKAKRAAVIRAGQRNSWLEIVLDEGKNRQIRRMLSALDINVLRLVRIAIGPLLLGDLAKGATRELTPGELKNLNASISLRKESRSQRRSE